MSIQVDGIVSGLDTSGLIEAIIAASGIPLQSLEARIADYEAKNEKITDLVNRIADVTSALEDMEAIGDFRSYAADYAENDAFSVEVDGDAVEGSYDIQIDSMAEAEQWVSTGFSASDSDAGMTGDLVFSYNSGSDVTVTVDGLSLEEIADAINSEDGVTAYVMDTGLSSNPYRLVVQGDDRGEDYSFDFSSSDAAVSSALGFDDSSNRTVQAASATLYINGIEVQSDTNTVTDAVPGMTITITGESTSAETVNVTSDPDAIEEKVQAFVDAYNDVVNFISTNSIYDTEEEIRGAFVGESGVRRVSQGMASIVTAQYSDLSQDYDSLSLIGITSTSTGTLEIDSSVFQEILVAEPDQVADLFTSADGFIAAMKDQLDVYTDSTTGSLAVRKDSIEGRIEDLNDDVAAMEDRIERLEDRLRSQFTRMEASMGELQSTGAFIAAMLLE